MKHSLKAVPAELKTDGPAGIVSYYAARFGNVDLVGDRVVKGAFTDTLAEWRRKGDPIPIVFSHKWDQADSIIGWSDPNDVVEDDLGLRVTGQLLMDNPEAKYIYELVSLGVLKGASFAYDTVKQSTAADGANELLQLDLIETGPCLVGANPAAGDFSAKGVNLDELEAALDLADSYRTKIVPDLASLRAQLAFLELVA